MWFNWDNFFQMTLEMIWQQFWQHFWATMYWIYYAMHGWRRVPKPIKVNARSTWAEINPELLFPWMTNQLFFKGNVTNNKYTSRTYIHCRYLHFFEIITSAEITLKYGSISWSCGFIIIAKMNELETTNDNVKGHLAIAFKSLL